ncbi:hypothetical protein ABVT39_012891 [Epinephelus coioides]
MVAGPEIATMTADFENKSSPQSENRHHEQQPAMQEAFMKHVRSLTAVIEEMGNPFLEESQDLLVLDSKDIMSSAVADTLYVSCQTHDGNLDQFFSHENQEAPPSLSQGGKIRLGTKADLLHCMMTDDTDSKRAPVVDAVFLDGAAVFQMLNPGTAKTFQDYADSVFVPYAKSQLEKTRCLDIIWDVYIPDSLKGTTRQKRGKGIRRRCDITNLTPCSHKEADTCLLLHVSDAVQKGCKKVTIRTVDTKVVVLAVAMFRKIKPEEMWIALAKKLDPSTCAALPLFHALTGCDTVSAFAGRGKKKAWESWKAFPEVTEAFNELLQIQGDVSELSKSQLERFVVLMYDRTSETTEVNEARKQLFTQKSRALENMPPTKAALEQHIKGATYQVNVWCKALEPCPQLPGVGWQPLWTTLPEASQSCYELIHCGCKKGCTTRCKCKKAALRCTALCSCSGDC